MLPVLPVRPRPKPAWKGSGISSEEEEGHSRSPRPPSDEEDEEDEGMLRMSFLEHLEELRSRIIKILIGMGVALGISLTFCDPLWHFVVQPAKAALIANGYPPTLAQITPMEAFNVIWFHRPASASAACPLAVPKRAWPQCSIATPSASTISPSALKPPSPPSSGSGKTGPPCSPPLS